MDSSPPCPAARTPTTPTTAMMAITMTTGTMKSCHGSPASWYAETDRIRAVSSGQAGQLPGRPVPCAVERGHGVPVALAEQAGRPAPARRHAGDAAELAPRALGRQRDVLLHCPRLPVVGHRRGVPAVRGAGVVDAGDAHGDTALGGRAGDRHEEGRRGP